MIKMSDECMYLSGYILTYSKKYPINVDEYECGERRDVAGWIGEDSVSSNSLLDFTFYFATCS